MSGPSMREQALDVARQFEVGLRAGAGAAPAGSWSAVALVGLGGSAAGGRLAVALFAERLRVPVVTVDATTLPGWVGTDTLVVCTSYSGATVETLRLWDQAGERGATRVAVTAGGALGDRARSAGAACAIVEPGFAPRGALGLLLGAITAILDVAGAAPGAAAHLQAAIPALAGSIDALDAAASDAIAVEAADLVGAAVFIYGSGPRAAAALRIKNQLNENAKVVAVAGTLPELAHNEILGWLGAARHGLPCRLILLRDPAEDALSVALADAIATLVRADVGVVVEWRGRGADELERTLDLLLRGDLVSLALAEHEGVDAADIERLTALKDTLGAS